jgi:hypothetical protein
LPAEPNNTTHAERLPAATKPIMQSGCPLKPTKQSENNAKQSQSGSPVANIDRQPASQHKTVINSFAQTGRGPLVAAEKARKQHETKDRAHSRNYEPLLHTLKIVTKKYAKWDSHTILTYLSYGLYIK